MTLKEIIQSKTDLLENAETKLYDGIEAAEKNIFSKVLSILRGLAQKEGRLRKDTVNNSLLKTLSVKVLTAIRESTLERKINDFLPNFETIEKLNDDILFDLTGKKFTQKVKKEIGVYRRLLVNEVVDRILGDAQIEANFSNPIKRILFNGIATRQKVSDIENELRKFIKGDKNKSGRFSRYVKQITIDSLNAHDGTINQIAAETYQLDGVMYVGSLIKTSRSNCVHLVNSSAKIAPFAIRKGLYRISDLPEIIEVLNKGDGSGWKEGTNENNFLINRCGFGCRHSAIAVPLSAEDKLKDITKGV